MKADRYTEKTFAPFFDFAARAVDTGRLPSAVVGVADREGVIGVRAYGRRPDGPRVAEEQEYALFSITKPIVGIAIAQLWEQGALSLDHEVKRYIPGFGANRPDSVKVWHLLTHTSGMEEEPNKSLFLAGKADPHLLDTAVRSGCRFFAGTRKLYCSLAFAGLEEIVRVVTGQELEAYLQERVFAPLGMKRTSFETYRSSPGRIMPVEKAEAYDIDFYLRARHPAGGLFGSAGDLLRLGRALLNGGRLGGVRILGPLTLEAMTTAQTEGIPASRPDDFVDIEVGYGWFLPRGGHRIIAGSRPAGVYGHDGWAGCMFWMHPREGVCFSFMTNLLDAAVHGAEPAAVHNVFASCLG
jgi:CubicO group peptidase (beta-lactamase class C family)